VGAPEAAVKDTVIVVSVTAEKIIFVGCALDPDEGFFVLACAPEVPEQPVASTVTSTCTIVLQLNEL